MLRVCLFLSFVMFVFIVCVLSVFVLIFCVSTLRVCVIVILYSYRFIVCFDFAVFCYYRFVSIWFSVLFICFIGFCICMFSRVLLFFLN